RDCLVANRIIVPNWLTVLRRCPRGDVSAGFSVAPVRRLVDSRLLVVSQIATRWNRCVPIKVNVFLWRFSLNKLPSRVNLDRKCIDVGSVLCPICQDDVESVNHIFFSCEMAKVLWDLLARWWELDIPVCANISEWYSWLDSLHASPKVRSFLEGVRALAHTDDAGLSLQQTKDWPQRLCPIRYRGGEKSSECCQPRVEEHDLTHQGKKSFARRAGLYISRKGHYEDLIETWRAKTRLEPETGDINTENKTVRITLNCDMQEHSKIRLEPAHPVQDRSDILDCKSRGPQAFPDAIKSVEELELDIEDKKEQRPSC
ncbi:RNA-directed DNA polymerase, eukaryota, reverse transcriptase zinc-binding domain protein, partial [Tanacetum coccineum]